LAFIVFEWLKRIEPTAPHFMTQEFYQYQCIHGRQQKFLQGWGNVEILLILFRLLTMQCKWMFTKRFTLSTPIVCAGCTSILNHLSETDMGRLQNKCNRLRLLATCSITITKEQNHNVIDYDYVESKSRLQSRLHLCWDILWKKAKPIWKVWGKYFSGNARYERMQ